MSRRFIGLPNVKATGFSGTLAVANGGTGQATAGQYGLMIGRSAGTVQGTATTAEQTIATATIPAGLMTTSGQIMVEGALTTGALAGTYTLNIRYGGIAGAAALSFPTIGASSNQAFHLAISNNNSLSAQSAWGWARAGSANQNFAPTTGAINFALSQTVVIDITLTTAADNTLVTLIGWSAIVYP